MISAWPNKLMSQETKYSTSSEYLGSNNSGDHMQISFSSQNEQLPLRQNQSQGNLNQFDIQSLFGPISGNYNQPDQQSCDRIAQYQEEQQQHTLASMINEFSLMHDQQVDLLNQRRIRDRLDRRSESFSLRENQSIASRSGNCSNRNPCGRNTPFSSPSSSSACFMTGNQVDLGLNSTPGSIVPHGASDQSPSLAPSSHHTPPDSPVTDHCHTLTPSNSVPAPMTLGNNNDNSIQECNAISVETQRNSFVTSTNSSHDQRPRVYSVSGQVTSSTRVQLPVSSPSSNHSPLPSSTSSSHIQEASSTGPFLRIIEQPTNRIRYRYKSEKGSHGGLTGEHNSQSKKTYPTVKLENYKIDHNVTIMIKASLVTNEERPKPHVHKLMGKNCTSDGTCLLPLSENCTASFQNLGILFIGKKEVPDILYQRKLKESNSRLFQHEGGTVNGDGRSTAIGSERLREEAEREAKDMNLNCVKLSFQAFDCTTDSNYTGGNQPSPQGMHQQVQINFPITGPIFSRSVANQKSPDSGELKIVRMDKNSGCVTGDEEVFLLCEKVNKKEIKVRFFEPDADGNTIWESYGNFSESDVHHQVAIVLRTPAYRQTEIGTLAHVYLQLYRPKDGEYSEPRQFTYYPRTASYPHSQPQFFRSAVDSNKRRKLISYHSSPILGQQQVQAMNQHCPNVNISTLAQPCLPQPPTPSHQQVSINEHCIQSIDTGSISTSAATSSLHSPTSTSSPGLPTAAQNIAGFFAHN